MERSLSSLCVTLVSASLLTGLVDAQGSNITEAFSPFQCQSSSEQRQVFTPNIPDLYFQHLKAAHFRTGIHPNLTTLERAHTYIFPLPEAGRDCSGTVTALQYCYQVRRDWAEPRNVLTFLSLTSDGRKVTVNHSFRVTAKEFDNDTCTSTVDGTVMYCCETTPLNREQFRIPASNYMFGVVIQNYQLLGFADVVEDYEVTQYRKALESGAAVLGTGSSFTLDEMTRLNNPLPLLRFTIDSDESVTNAPATSTVTTPHDLGGPSPSDPTHDRDDPTQDINDSDDIIWRRIGVTLGAIVLAILILVALALLMRRKLKTKLLPPAYFPRASSVLASQEYANTSVSSYTRPPVPPPAATAEGFNITLNRSYVARHYVPGPTAEEINSTLNQHSDDTRHYVIEPEAEEINTTLNQSYATGHYVTEPAAQEINQSYAIGHYITRPAAQEIGTALNPSYAHSINLNPNVAYKPHPHARPHNPSHIDSAPARGMAAVGGSPHRRGREADKMVDWPVVVVVGEGGLRKEGETRTPQDRSRDRVLTNTSNIYATLRANREPSPAQEEYDYVTP